MHNYAKQEHRTVRLKSPRDIIASVEAIPV
jgi:hypothetical protein